MGSICDGSVCIHASGQKGNYRKFYLCKNLLRCITGVSLVCENLNMNMNMDEL